MSWTESGRCSSCKFCGMDMEMDPFCVHPKVIKNHIFGLNLASAIKRYCGDGDKLILREPKESK